MFGWASDHNGSSVIQIILQNCDRRVVTFEYLAVSLLELSLIRSKMEGGSNMSTSSSPDANTTTRKRRWDIHFLAVTLVIAVLLLVTYGCLEWGTPGMGWTVGLLVMHAIVSWVGLMSTINRARSKSEMIGISIIATVLAVATTGFVFVFYFRWLPYFALWCLLHGGLVFAVPAVYEERQSSRVRSAPASRS